MSSASSKVPVTVEKSLLTRKANDLDYLNVWALTILLNDRIIVYESHKKLSSTMFL